MAADAGVNIERHFHRAGGVLWHYRAAGDVAAPALVLLHPSPRSSAMYEPWMQTLSAHFRVLAIDTPGYGASAPLPNSVNSANSISSANSMLTLHDYIVPLHALLQSIAGPRCTIYGSATGAQIGIAYANAQPQAVQHLLIDNAAHFDDAERDRIVARYFPDLTPRADGSHLASAWQMCAQMLEFFPWFEADEAHRIAPAPAPPAAVHASVQELLAAGPNYAAAYRAAFEHERAAHVQSLTVPTSLLRWRGSILLRHIDRLIASALPPSVRVIDIPAPLPDRYAAMTAHLLGLHNSMAPITGASST